ncbi:MAG: sporulation protein YunB [Methylocystaceae bacterium]
MRRIRIKPWAILVLIGLIVVFFLISLRLTASFKQAALSQAQLEGVGAVNRAVLDTVVKEVKYERLVIIRQDSEGQVVLVQPNPVEISRIVALTQLAVKDQMDQLESKNISLPLGLALGSPLVSSMGPHVTIRVMPVGSVNVNLRDSFESAGINQTRHLITLDIKSTIKVIVPFYHNEVKISTQMPLAETIIVGRIPATYLQWGKGFNERLR